MRGVAGIFIGLVLWLLPSFGCLGQIDSTRLRELDGRLEEYFRTIEPERIEVKSRECDLLIDSHGHNDLIEDGQDPCQDIQMA